MILCPCKFFWHRAKYHQIQLPLLWVLLHATRPKCSYYITHVKWSSLMSNKNTFFMNDVLVNQPLDPATQLGENIMQRRRLNLYTMQREKMVATASLYWQSSNTLSYLSDGPFRKDVLTDRCMGGEWQGSSLSQFCITTCKNITQFLKYS